MRRTVLMALATLSAISCSSEQAEQTLYVGTYGEAIHILGYTPSTGALRELDAIPAQNPSYIALKDNGKTLLAVSEQGDDSGVYSFAATDQGWEQTSRLSDVGADPCYILPIENSEMVATADYTGGDFSIYIMYKRRFDTREDWVSFKPRYTGGNVPVPGRQESAHIHQVKEIPGQMVRAAGIEGGRFFVISDLGCDLIRLGNLYDGGLEMFGTLECGAGAGPRHMEFNVSAGLLYCLTELSGEVIVWEIGDAGGIPEFKERQRIVADLSGSAGSADIHLHPSGKWLFTSHRNGGDGITTFAVRSEDGLLERVSFAETGEHPRNFTFSPDGKRLLAACRDTRSIQVYDILEDGSLSPMVFEFTLSSDQPVCLVF